MSLYVFDDTGTLPANHITNELHNVIPPTNLQQANFIVPRAAPFFKTGLVVRTGPLITDPVLVEGTDYIFTHYFVEASRYLGKAIYGSINFLNLSFTGNVYLSYQTLGGNYTLDDYSIVENLTRSLYNIRTVYWTQIVGNFPQFPPIPHPHNVADMTGFLDLITAINNLVTTIASQGSNVGSLSATLTNHINAVLSHTKEQVGLGNLNNWLPANQVDVDLALTNRYMTPQMTRYAIMKFNMGGVELLDADDTVKGITRYATDLEAADGNLNTVAITPQGLWAALEQYRLLTEIAIGDLYLTTVQSRDPATFLGYGTWVRFGEGRVMLGFSTTDPTFDTALATGGSKTATIDRGYLPAEGININIPVRTGGGGTPTTTPALDRNQTDSGTATLTTENLGSGNPLPILNPYIVVCFWLRTA